MSEHRTIDGHQWPIDDDGQAIFWRNDRFEIVGEPVPWMGRLGCSGAFTGRHLDEKPCDVKNQDLCQIIHIQ